MPDRHKHDPVSFRPPEADRIWLEQHAAATGLTVRAILKRALQQYRERQESATVSGGSSATPTCAST